MGTNSARDAIIDAALDAWGDASETFKMSYLTAQDITSIDRPYLETRSDDELSFLFRLWQMQRVESPGDVRAFRVNFAINGHIFDSEVVLARSSEGAIAAATTRGAATYVGAYSIGGRLGSLVEPDRWQTH